MFQKFTSDVVGFPSAAYEERSQTDTGTQKSSKSNANAETQVAEAKTEGTQTEDDLPQATPKYDEDSLLKFLRKWEIPLYQELALVEGDFDDYDEATDFDCQLLHKLPNPTDSMGKVSCIAWNSRGGTIAVGRSVVRHSAWCSHESSFSSYILAHKGPPRVFRTVACVTSIDFHPKNPSHLLVGLFNGDVLVADLSHDEEWIACEPTTQHTGQVTAVRWSDESSQFLTAASDGCILLRECRYTTRTISTLLRFFISQGRLFPPTTSDRALEISVLAQVKAGHYVAGLAGCALVHCNLTPLQPSSNREGYLDPVSYTYQPPHSVITAVKPAASSEIFAVSSVDGLISVYKIFQSEPAWVFNNNSSVLDFFWTTSSHVLGICGWNNCVKFVQVFAGEAKSKLLEIEAGETVVCSQTSRNRKKVALGSHAGKIQVWSIENVSAKLVE